MMDDDRAFIPVRGIAHPAPWPSQSAYRDVLSALFATPASLSANTSRVLCCALCNGLVVTGEFQHFCVGIVPTSAPAVMCPFTVGDGCKALSIPRGIIFFVSTALQRFQSPSGSFPFSCATSPL
jgi:hypothetical protein